MTVIQADEGEYRAARASVYAFAELARNRPQHRSASTDMTFFFFFFLSSGGWEKIKLYELTTLPRIFIRVVCRFNSVAFAAQR